MADRLFERRPLFLREVVDGSAVADAFGADRLAEHPHFRFIEMCSQEIRSVFVNAISKTRQFVGGVQIRRFHCTQRSMGFMAIFLANANRMVCDGFLNLDADILEFFKSFKARTTFSIKLPRNHAEEAFGQFQLAACSGEQLFPPLCHRLQLVSKEIV